MLELDRILQSQGFGTHRACVALIVAGKIDAAHNAMMQWVHPPEIAPRRRREQALFFDGTWSNDGQALVFDVAKPSYRPGRSHQVPIAQMIQSAMGGQ